MESGTEQPIEVKWTVFVEELRLKYGRSENEIMADIPQEIPGRRRTCGPVDSLEDLLLGGWADTSEDAYVVLAAVVGFPRDGGSASQLADVERGLYLWRSEKGTLVPPPFVGSSFREVSRIAVEVAPYLAGAGLGGIIGSRADAVFVRSAKRLFESVRGRWRGRAAKEDAPLTEEEAVDAARAAALTRSHPLESLRVVSSVSNGDGSWTVYLRADTEVLRARVPPGDPADATILIVAS